MNDIRNNNNGKIYCLSKETRSSPYETTQNHYKYYKPIIKFGNCNGSDIDSWVEVADEDELPCSLNAADY